MAVSSSRLSATHRSEVDLTDDRAVDAREVHAHDTEFARLYDEFSLRVVGLVRRFITDEDLVDDLVQETFLRAYNGGLHLEYLEADRERDQWPWLAAVARNLALDAIRKRRGAIEDELNDEVVEQFEAVDDPEVQLLASRRREGIAEALQDLCPRQRRMLILKHVNGWAYNDIAEREGISVEALKSALARARRTFRSAYANIAERGGLSVVLGALVTRVPAKLREVRDRFLAAPEALSATAAASPGLMNTLATMAALGAVGAAAGVLGGTPAGATSEPTVPIAEIDKPSAEELRVAVVPDPVARVVESEETAESADPATDTTPIAETEPAASGTETSAALDTADVAPASAAPSRGSSAASVQQDDDSVRVELLHEADLDGDGSNEGSDGGGSVSADCPPPEKRTLAGSVACPVLEGDNLTPEAL